MNDEDLKELSDLLNESIITSNSGSEYYVKIKCESLIKLHEIHRVILKIARIKS